MYRIITRYPHYFYSVYQVRSYIRGTSTRQQKNGTNVPYICDQSRLICCVIHTHDTNIGLVITNKRSTNHANLPAGEVGAGVRGHAVLRRDGVLGRGQGGGRQNPQSGGGAGGLSRGVHRLVDLDHSSPKYNSRKMFARESKRGTISAARLVNFF